ncbi:hypothetical protein RRG08_002972 [Elysia crispata]|uniref:Uncharacterized protein n=1 Tax=Elysia crispata TaxID=231223 RepID=A0AAE0XQI5_9GAST|nr:hypothetical protein RRG08_002972 [Elysia crispata]
MEIGGPDGHNHTSKSQMDFIDYIFPHQMALIICINAGWHEKLTSDTTSGWISEIIANFRFHKREVQEEQEQMGEYNYAQRFEMESIE